MKFESFGINSNKEKPEETIDQSKRGFLRTAGGLATGAALSAAGMMPEDAEAFGAAVSPEDFAKDYVDQLEIPKNLGNPEIIKKQIKDTYVKLSPAKRSFYVMMMPGNCPGKTILQSFDPSTGSIEVICKSR